MIGDIGILWLFDFRRCGLDESLKQSCFFHYVRDRFITMGYIALVWITASVWVSSPLFQDKNHRKLPFPVWFPFNNSQDKIFWITYVPDALGVFIIPTIAVGNDAIFLGFLILINEQLKFLHHRLTDDTKSVSRAFQCEIPQYKIEIFEKKITRQHARHHLFILELVKCMKYYYLFILRF